MTLTFGRAAWRIFSIAARIVALGLVLCIVVFACAFYFVYHLLHFQKDLTAFGRVATVGLLLVLSCVTAYAGGAP